jgi:hypothetical protein
MNDAFAFSDLRLAILEPAARARPFPGQLTKRLVSANHSNF